MHDRQLFQSVESSIVDAAAELRQKRNRHAIHRKQEREKKKKQARIDNPLSSITESI
jgi:hypothetical protein